MPRRATPKKKKKPSPVAKTLSYKVVELSNVDEAALEHTVNEWVSAGWSFDGVQFAMRESSKRPAMAFVFFTRVGESNRFRSEASADAHLRRLVLGDEALAAVQPRTTADAYARLTELANGDDDS
jgi:hypothetical protein